MNSIAIKWIYWEKIVKYRYLEILFILVKKYRYQEILLILDKKILIKYVLDKSTFYGRQSFKM